MVLSGHRFSSTLDEMIKPIKSKKERTYDHKQSSTKEVAEQCILQAGSGTV